jgi:hypothetical protein
MTGDVVALLRYSLAFHSASHFALDFSGENRRTVATKDHNFLQRENNRIESFKLAMSSKQQGRFAYLFPGIATLFALL